ncbi:MAG: helix-turn-helix transcriptional regulator [Clostridia bacterium]|nr:helix-turn-helix transcriptional regulator [Clostridia bacterium]
MMDLCEVAEQYPLARIGMIRARRERRMTQEKVAEMLNVSRRYYCGIELGIVENPEPDVMRRALKILGLDEKALRGEEECRD